jgi:hypothetical protein
VFASKARKMPASRHDVGDSDDDDDDDDLVLMTPQ